MKFAQFAFPVLAVLVSLFPFANSVNARPSPNITQLQNTVMRPCKGIQLKFENLSIPVQPYVLYPPGKYYFNSNYATDINGIYDVALMAQTGQNNILPPANYSAFVTFDHSQDSLLQLIPNWTPVFIGVGSIQEGHLMINHYDRNNVMKQYYSNSNDNGEENPRYLNTLGDTNFTLSTKTANRFSIKCGYVGAFSYPDAPTEIDHWFKMEIRQINYVDPTAPLTPRALKGKKD
jgi:hypothetical protein